MKYVSFGEKIILPTRRDVLKVHLYAKLLLLGVIPYEKDLDVLVELYEIGGYANDVEQLRFFNTCLTKQFKKSVQSVRNTLAKYTELGVLSKPKNKKRKFSDEWLPDLADDVVVVLENKITHRASNK